MEVQGQVEEGEADESINIENDLHIVHIGVDWKGELTPLGKYKDKENKKWGNSYKMLVSVPRVFCRTRRRCRVSGWIQV